MMNEEGQSVTPPARLRALTSWQVSKVTTLGTRLTAQRMPLGARSDFALLAALDEYGPLSQADIGRRLGLDRNDVNAITTRLESQRFIVRRADPANRRRNIVRTTAAGQRHLELLQAHADAVQDELLTGLTSAERSQLHGLLQKLLSSHAPESA